MSKITDRHREFHEKFFAARIKALEETGISDYDFAMKEADEAGLRVVAEFFSEPSREPVAWLCEFKCGLPFITQKRESAECYDKIGANVTPLYK